MIVDLTGLADIITAITGLASLLISLYLVLRISRVQEKTDRIEDSTNSNFSRMQNLLANAMEVTEESAQRDRNRIQQKPTTEESGSSP